MQEDLELIKTERHEDGSYTEHWQKALGIRYAKTYTSKNKLVYVETIDVKENKCTMLQKYGYQDDFERVSFPSILYSPSKPEWKFIIHTVDSTDRCVSMEFYNPSSYDKFEGKTVISYNDDGSHVRRTVDYSIIENPSSSEAIYDTQGRKIYEIDYSTPDYQEKVRSTRIEYLDDNFIKTTTHNYYNACDTDIQNIKVSQILRNVLTEDFKETNYCDYEMTQIIDITESLRKQDGSKEITYTINNRKENDDYSHKLTESADGKFTKISRYYDPEFMQIYSVERIERNETGRTIQYAIDKYSEDGELISSTEERFDKYGNKINSKGDNKDTANNDNGDTYLENAFNVVSQLIEEEYREYVWEKIKTFYTIASQALKTSKDNRITAEIQGLGAKCVAEWTFEVAKLCINSKIPQEYFDTILQDSAMVVFEVLRQHFINDNEINIDSIMDSVTQYVQQTCKSLFEDLKDKCKITEECCATAVKCLESLNKTNL